LLSGAEFSDDLFWCVALALHGASPGQVWPLVKLHKDWFSFWGISQEQTGGRYLVRQRGKIIVTKIRRIAGNDVKNGSAENTVDNDTQA
mgnify:CR=1